jgi:hypothetical protein
VIVAMKEMHLSSLPQRKLIHKFLRISKDRFGGVDIKRSKLQPYERVDMSRPETLMVVEWITLNNYGNSSMTRMTGPRLSQILNGNSIADCSISNSRKNERINPPKKEFLTWATPEMSL